MTQGSILHIVHCIDTEGPLDESLENTFERLRDIFGISLPATRENLKKLQNRQIDLGGLEDEVLKIISPSMLDYNNSWEKIREMLEEALSPYFRNRMKDDRGQGWIYNWHIMDHVGYRDNPRNKALGYGEILHFYKDILDETNSCNDEINWHFHPLSFFRDPLQCATSYVNSYDVLIQILCRRIIEDRWFPVVNRPGFNSTRPDSHAFLEQWIPYDFANQSYEESQEGQPDLADGRFGDWRRAPLSWAGYQPSHDDYQLPGQCRRWIFRCLNVGCRTRPLLKKHVQQAFEEAAQKGSAIFAFTNHDYRDLRPHVNYVRELLSEVKLNYPHVKIQFSGAGEAAKTHVQQMTGITPDKLEMSVELVNNTLQVRILKGELFGPQPFLAIKSLDGQYFHDNLDLQEPKLSWSYVFDNQSIPIDQIMTIGISGASKSGDPIVLIKQLSASALSLS